MTDWLLALLALANAALAAVFVRRDRLPPPSGGNLPVRSSRMAPVLAGGAAGLVAVVAFAAGGSLTRVGDIATSPPEAVDADTLYSNITGLGYTSSSENNWDGGGLPTSWEINAYEGNDSIATFANLAAWSGLDAPPRGGPNVFQIGITGNDSPGGNDHTRSGYVPAQGSIDTVGVGMHVLLDPDLEPPSSGICSFYESKFFYFWSAPNGEGNNDFWFWVWLTPKSGDTLEWAIRGQSSGVTFIQGADSTSLTASFQFNQNVGNTSVVLGEWDKLEAVWEPPTGTGLPDGRIRLWHDGTLVVQEDSLGFSSAEVTGALIGGGNGLDYRYTWGGGCVSTADRFVAVAHTQVFEP